MSRESAGELKSDAEGRESLTFKIGNASSRLCDKNNRDTPAGEAEGLTAECQPVLGTL